MLEGGDWLCMASRHRRSATSLFVTASCLPPSPTPAQPTSQVSAALVMPQHDQLRLGRQAFCHCQCLPPSPSPAPAKLTIQVKPSVVILHTQVQLVCYQLLCCCLLPPPFSHPYIVNHTSQVKDRSTGQSNAVCLLPVASRFGTASCLPPLHRPHCKSTTGVAIVTSQHGRLVLFELLPDPSGWLPPASLPTAAVLLPAACPFSYRHRAHNTSWATDVASVHGCLLLVHIDCGHEAADTPPEHGQLSVLLCHVNAFCLQTSLNPEQPKSGQATKFADVISTLAGA